ISINGQELFVLPAYKTSYITTKGYPGYYEEDEDTDHGLIIDDGGNSQEIIIDDGGYTQEEIIIDDGGNTQEEIIIDDGGNTQEEIIIDDGDKIIPSISAASFLECDFNGQIKLEVTVTTYGPLTSPLNFFINLKGIEEFSAFCMMEDLPTNEASGESSNDEYNTFSSDGYDQISSNYDIRTYVATCTADSPKYGGTYFVEVESDSNGGTMVYLGGLFLTITPCSSQDTAEEKMSLSLSFRQVNTFDLNSFSFMFYALTSQTITSDTTIKFYFNFLDEYGSVLPSPVEANCTIEEPVTEIDQSIGVAPASFRCLFDEEYVTDEISSLQISSADGVAGLPLNDPTLINPKLTDDAINEGLLTNPAYEGGNLPSVISPIDYLVTYNEDKGVFTMVFDYTQGTVNDIVGQTFEIPLTYPGGINLEGTIIKYEDASLTIRFGIKGEIDSLPLIWEQTVISIYGQELFVLPAY
ncbi:hypothetical protein, partial [Ruminococcus sp.]|uniref:hypothetical protein n=1 Tax=Ruminococcus sp. TaxID=41978 RepID=UPI002E8107BE